MKIAQLGGGGREYALARNFVKHGHEVVGFPGNAGFMYLGAGTHPYEGPEQFADYFEKNGFDLAVAGPENHLEEGLGNLMQERELPFFGPRRAHARAEWDKGYFHQLMMGTGLAPPGAVFRSRIAAEEYLRSQWGDGKQYVVKSVELHGGKGVFVEDTIAGALEALELVMTPKPQGWGDDVLLQRRMKGTGLNGGEFSTTTILGIGGSDYDSRTVNFDSSMDNKPVGPNRFGIDPKLMTGGMGGDSPHPSIGREEFDELLDTHTIPMIKRLEKDAGIGQSAGFVYNGLRMQINLVGKKARFQESNFGRMGDPEAQYLLSRLRSDLAKYLKAAVDGSLGDLPPLEFDPRPSVTLAMCTPGYPTDAYKENRGKPLRGLEIVEANPNMIVFFAGVGEDDGKLVNTGGRVFYVSYLADTRDEAWDVLYGIVDGGRAIGLGDGPEDVHFRLDLKNPMNV